MTLSNGIIFHFCAITGEFLSQRPVTRRFYVFFDLRLNKWLSKQSRCQWFEMPLHWLWCHCNDWALKGLILSLKLDINISTTAAKAHVMLEGDDIIILPPNSKAVLSRFLSVVCSDSKPSFNPISCNLETLWHLSKRYCIMQWREALDRTFSHDTVKSSMTTLMDHKSDMKLSLIAIWQQNITVMSNEHDGISNLWQYHCMFNSLSRLTTKKLSNVYITGPLCGESSGFPTLMASEAESISMSWHHGEILSKAVLTWVETNRTVLMDWNTDMKL